MKLLVTMFAIAVKINGYSIKSIKSYFRTNAALYMSTGKSVNSEEHERFIAEKARALPPKNLKFLLELLQHRGDAIISPSQRSGLNPFLIPLSQSDDGVTTAYIRWPTMKEGAELQIVKTNEIGVSLVSVDTDKYCHRLVVEKDFESTDDALPLIENANLNGITYKSGDYISLIKSGKFPATTHEDRHLILNKYILTKVGSFPDCYERIATNFLKTGSEISAFVTNERAISVFYGWGHPMAFNAELMTQAKGRETEARDAAKAALAMPLWTVAPNMKAMNRVAQLAGFTGAAILGDMHAFRAKDPRTDEIGEGLSPAQVILDQAAHLMDAVAIGSVQGGWEGCKQDLAQKYREGGYPDMADFIMA